MTDNSCPCQGSSNIRKCNHNSQGIVQSVLISSSIQLHFLWDFVWKKVIEAKRVLKYEIIILYKKTSGEDPFVSCSCYVVWMQSVRHIWQTFRKSPYSYQWPYWTLFYPSHPFSTPLHPSLTAFYSAPCLSSAAFCGCGIIRGSVSGQRVVSLSWALHHHSSGQQRPLLPASKTTLSKKPWLMENDGHCQRAVLPGVIY